MDTINLSSNLNESNDNDNQKYDEEINTILNAIICGFMSIDTLKNVDSEISVAIGNFFAEKEQYDKMEKCYLFASEKKNKDAYNNLAIYYTEIEDYNNMIKYLELCDNPETHFELGNYYRKTNNIEKMLFHWTKSNTSNSFTNIGIYYYTIKDDEKIIEYWIKANSKDSLLRLSKYYLEKLDLENMTKYLNMSILLNE